MPTKVINLFIWSGQPYRLQSSRTESAEVPEGIDATADPFRLLMPRTVPRSVRETARLRVVLIARVLTRRLWIVFLILCTGLVGLVGRLAWLQLVQTGELESRARRLQTQTSETLGQRRPIVDRTGRLVAMDEVRFRLWAHPRYFNLPGDAPDRIRPPEDVVELLATPLAKPAQQLLKELGERRSGVKLAEGLDPKTAEQIRSLGISGLDLEAYPQRFIPRGIVRQRCRLPQRRAGAPGGS